MWRILYEYNYYIAFNYIQNKALYYIRKLLKINTSLLLLDTEYTTFLTHLL